MSPTTKMNHSDHQEKKSANSSFRKRSFPFTRTSDLHSITSSLSSSFMSVERRGNARSKLERSLSHQTRSSNRWVSLGERQRSLIDSSQHSCCQQLTQRIDQLEKEILARVHSYPMSTIYSPFSPMTPNSPMTVGAGGTGTTGIAIYPSSRSFSISLSSPHASVPTQKYGLSSKILERAHLIPERFWIDWQEKQKQHRIEEIETMKTNHPIKTSLRPNDLNLSTTQNRRKSLLLLHNSHNQSDPEPYKSMKRSPSPLDRSDQNLTLTHSIPSTITTEGTLSRTSSLEDVAEIDTELTLTFVSHEKPPVFYSRATLNRSIAFRSFSPRKDRGMTETTN